MVSLSSIGRDSYLALSESLKLKQVGMTFYPAITMPSAPWKPFSRRELAHVGTNCVHLDMAFYSCHSRSRLEAIALRLEAIAIGVDASWLQALPCRSVAIQKGSKLDALLLVQGWGIPTAPGAQVRASPGDRSKMV